MGGGQWSGRVTTGGIRDLTLLTSTKITSMFSILSVHIGNIFIIANILYNCIVANVCIIFSQS